MAGLFSILGLPLDLPVLNLILPLGISFYTFQSMSYVFDISRFVTKPADNFLDFALYVSFFPHLVAGPIMRSGNLDKTIGQKGLLTQVANTRTYRKGDFQQGFYHIVSGLFKKVVIGDNMAVIVNTIFGSDINTLSGLECLAGIYAFAFQIYADFSGYSSIAQGVAKWMGFDLIFNFKMPYLAKSPQDFWRRWHISLSSWLRDYVYISFGGNRAGMLRMYRNLMLTMILGGIWHGANWTFLAWGTFHGVILSAYRFLGNNETQPVKKYSPLSSLWRVLIMFHLTCIGWLFFRAETIHKAFAMLVRLTSDFRMTKIGLSILFTVLLYAGPLMIYEVWVEKKKNLLVLNQAHWSVQTLVYSYILFMIILFPPPVAHEFIYFQF